MRTPLAQAFAIAFMGAAALLTAGCSTPAYEKPAVEAPPTWKVDAPWRESKPDDAAARGPWWRRFGDAQLDTLEQQALDASPTLAIAAARLTQARATVDASNAGLFPQLTASFRGARQEISANRPLSNYGVPNASTVQNDFVPAFTVSYEADLWGRLRGTVQAARASEQQSAADFENARLVLTTDLAANYFNLRELDIEIEVVAQSVALQRKALDLATARHDLGATSGLDVAQQQALLDSTLTQAELLQRQRDQFEHAIAALVGRPAPLFAIAPQVTVREAPAIALGIPSDVLERRPDVASAERAVAAANAQIGVARAAYFPSLVFAASTGLESRVFSTLVDTPSTVWSLGASIVAPIFDAGRTKANVAFARAGYDAAVANYRRTVLTAFQEVQDGISGSVVLDRALMRARQAEGSAQRVLQLANDRYEGGATGYLDVINAQQSLLTAQRQLAQLEGQRLLVGVFLVKALGGDWHPTAAS